MKITPNMLKSLFQNLWHDEATDSFVNSGQPFPEILVKRVTLIERISQSEPELPEEICSALANVCHLLREDSEASMPSLEMFKKHIESLAFLCSLNNDLLFTSETVIQIRTLDMELHEMFTLSHN